MYAPATKLEYNEHVLLNRSRWY